MGARRVVIGLGSNLGNRAETILFAIDRLQAEPGLYVVATSSLYESSPAGGPPQRDYINAAVLIETSLPAREVLDRMLAIERSLGRIRPAPVPLGPRTIDLDLLWIDGESIAESGLIVPHPRLAERVFALRPLLDVAPDACDPQTTRRLSSLPAASEPIKRIDNPPSR